MVGAGNYIIVMALTCNSSPKIELCNQSPDWSIGRMHSCVIQYSQDSRYATPILHSCEWFSVQHAMSLVLCPSAVQRQEQLDKIRRSVQTWFLLNMNCAAEDNSHPKNLHPRISPSLLYVVCIYNSYTAYLYCTKCTISTECGACLHQNSCCTCGACGARSSDGWWRRACMQLATQRGPAFRAPRQREQPSLT